VVSKPPPIILVATSVPQEHTLLMDLLVRTVSLDTSQPILDHPNVLLALLDMVTPPIPPSAELALPVHHHRVERFAHPVFPDTFRRQEDPAPLVPPTAVSSNPPSSIPATHVPQEHPRTREDSAHVARRVISHVRVVIVFHALLDTNPILNRRHVSSVHLEPFLPTESLASHACQAPLQLVSALLNAKSAVLDRHPTLIVPFALLAALDSLLLRVASAHSVSPDPQHALEVSASLVPPVMVTPHRSPENALVVPLHGPLSLEVSAQSVLQVRNPILEVFALTVVPDSLLPRVVLACLATLVSLPLLVASASTVPQADSRLAVVFASIVPQDSLPSRVTQAATPAAPVRPLLQEDNVSISVPMV